VRFKLIAGMNFLKVPNLILSFVNSYLFATRLSRFKHQSQLNEILLEEFCNAKDDRLLKPSTMKMPTYTTCPMLIFPEKPVEEATEQPLETGEP
jgi:hypothetical protein